MSELREIETATNHYARLREELRTVAAQCHGELNQVRERYRALIRAAASSAAAAHDDLAALVDRHRHLFDKPRTRLFSGIKVGLKKQPGRLEFSDATDRVIKLIRKRLPERADVLIRTSEDLNREAIRDLDGLEMAMIGAALVATGDTVVISHPSDEIDALIDALTTADDES